ncbi:nitrate- and nitrite sensing domain-containing protein [Streptomyces sp. NPDC060022]|uniref:sensor histidine kinase n=1 Tax=Streptomyces sp. NPDC060022 TaxID=3347039 RepID=UPI00367BBE80
MRLADLRVRHRIVVLAALPLTAAVLLTAPLVTERVQSARESAQSAGELRLAQDVGGLVADLQRERLFSGAYLATPGSEGNAVVRQATQTDADVSDLRDKWLGAGVPPELAAALQDASDLDTTRGLVLKRGLTLTDVNIRYGSIISALIDALPFSGTAEGNRRGAFGREQATMEELLRVHESGSSFGVLLLAVVSERERSGQLMADVEGRTAIANAERSRFLRAATTSELDLFQTVESGRAAATIRTYADTLTLWSYAHPHSGVERSEPPDGVSAARIFEASGSLDQLRLLVQNKIARDSVAVASADASEDSRWALAFIVAVLALAIIMVWLTAWIARSIARPLGLLHGAAEQVAQAAEAELTRVTEDDEGSPSGRHTPVPMRRVPAFTKDELGQLAVAFNRVQDATISLMERQVRSRDNAAAMLGNVGRRTQNLAALQLSMIDSMERSETDPELLESLYRLDHVSSRLRRYANSLVVLSGWTETVLASSPAPLTELTRSALGKIEGFRRVRLGKIPPLRVASHVAADLSLVIAELLDNATSFSPPTSPVEFSAQELPDGRCLIEIVDYGVGMTELRLVEENARFIRKERLDLVSTDFLGLFVVGRLSRRHHFHVQLEHTPGSGVTARIMMPAAVFDSVAYSTDDRELAVGTHQPPALGPAAGRLTAVPSQAPETGVMNQLGGAHTNGEASLTPSGPGPFDWFDTDLELGSKPVANQGLTAVHSARSQGERTLPPAQGRAPGLLPVRRTRPATAPAFPAAAPAPAVMRPEPPGGGASKSARLVRRVPGAQMPAGSFVPNIGRLGSEPMDPEAARAMIEEFEAGIARATQSRPSPEGDRDEKR